MDTLESLTKDQERQQVIFTVDDYSEYNIRMAEILKMFTIPAVFFIEMMPQQFRGTIDESKEQIKKIHDMGFGIGGHSYSHPMDMKQLDDVALDWEILQNKEMLEELIGEPIVDFAYTRGRFNEHVKEFVKDAGYTHARTTRLGDAFNYDDPLELSSSVHIYNGRKEYDGKKWDDIARERWAKGESLHIFCHSWEVHRDGEWERMMKLIKELAQ